MNIIFAILEQSLTLAPLVLGMFLSYRILKITDLTVDGTYVLGAAIFARFVDVGLFQAIVLAIIAGAIVGIVVAFMQRNNVVNDLIAGVLASFMLYSVNLQIMGRPNISTLESNGQRNKNHSFRTCSCRNRFVDYSKQYRQAGDARTSCARHRDILVETAPFL